MGVIELLTRAGYKVVDQRYDVYLSELFRLREQAIKNKAKN